MYVVKGVQRIYKQYEHAYQQGLLFIIMQIKICNKNR